VNGSCGNKGVHRGGTVGKDSKAVAGRGCSGSNKDGRKRNSRRVCRGFHKLRVLDLGSCSQYLRVGYHDLTSRLAGKVFSLMLKGLIPVSREFIRAEKAGTRRKNVDVQTR